MIRRMTLNDIDNVMILIEKHFYASDADKRMHTYDGTSVKESLVDAFNSSVCFINEDAGDIDGIIMYTIFPSLFDRKQLRAIERMWYAYSPKIMIKLHDHMIGFIKNDVDVISIGIPTTNDTGKFLERDGFKLTEYVYSKKGGN